ncbi:MAG TPA: hypothetical protein VGV10_04220 [Thermoleophilaceae bacterium]|nr:hypothetical protein [Thermoleophilaceae bacterium]
MATPSAQFSLTLRVELSHEPGTVGGKVTTAITRAAGWIVALETLEAHGSGTLREITINRESEDHRGKVIKGVQGVSEASLIETIDRRASDVRRLKDTAELSIP